MDSKNSAFGEDWWVDVGVISVRTGIKNLSFDLVVKGLDWDCGSLAFLLLHGDALETEVETCTRYFLGDFHSFVNPLEFASIDVLLLLLGGESAVHYNFGDIRENLLH